MRKMNDRFTRAHDRLSGAPQYAHHSPHCGTVAASPMTHCNCMHRYHVFWHAKSDADKRTTCRIGDRRTQAPRHCGASAVCCIGQMASAGLIFDPSLRATTPLSRDGPRRMTPSLGSSGVVASRPVAQAAVGQAGLASARANAQALARRRLDTLEQPQAGSRTR
jgi:hypothetical protein